MIRSLSGPGRRFCLWTALAGLFLFTTAGVLAQTGGAIKGKVTTSDGQPAEYATVVLSGGKATRVDKDGLYHFSNLAPGAYTLTVTFTGQEPRVQQVTVAAGETATADLTLAASALALNEVVIVGDKYTITSRKESNNVARLPLKYMENPQVYNVVDKELIREQMSLTLDESFRNVPGAAPAKTGAGIPAFFSRGFQTSDNLRNGMATYIRTTIDLATVERVETIKGPASTLFGASMISFGGLVNYVTKKPFDHLGGEVSYTQGSYDLSRLTADFNAPVNADSSLLFRVNMAYQKENTFQDQGHGTTFMIAPSLSYRVSDRLVVRLDADLQNFSGTASTGWSIGGATNVNSYDKLKINHERSLIDNSFVAKMYSNNIFMQAEYKLSEHWTSTTNYAWATGGYNNMYIFYMNWTSDTTVARTVGVHTPDKLGRKHLQQNFTGDFMIGNMRNRLVVGLDFMDQYRDLKYTAVALDVVDPRGTVAPVYVEQVDNTVAASTTPQNHTKQYTYGAYFSDVLNVTENLLVMASLRVDRFTGKGTKNNLTQQTTGDYGQSAVSPKFGVVYQVVPGQVSLFGNYMNGFKNVASVSQPDGTVSNFKPQQANQAEGGIKLDLLGGKLGATASYYNIEVTKTTRQELVDGRAFTVQDGTQESKGVEVEIIANPLPGFNLVSGYGYNDNSFTKADATIVGKRALGTPEHVGNIWLSYTLLKGAVKGLGAAGGVMYVSDVFADNINRFTLPEYTVLDATLFYNTPKYRLSFKANNVAGKKYWVSDGFYVRPQKTANFLVSMTVRF
ncbi:TonB-dependent receptor [Dawidia soli]|uniref:TonB-dependent siderophore receptor n=1 Tax=Dawidia soli TaxID=2782352 RepID=A0AAP2D679_9BACT|nr:TonB-dependent receptor [Dawidia soli]MBT1685814.1 TonB-dependent siderophore receptor [Dawidia soli]